MATATGSQVEEIDDFLGHVKLINLLLGDGITAGDIEKLQEAGFYTVASVVYYPKKYLQAIKDFGEAKVEKLIAEASKMVFVGFRPASEVHRLRERVVFISTGSDEVDRLLGGGIETGSVTEIFGESCSGKSLMCHTLAVNVQLPRDMGGAEAKCIYIHTDGSFSPNCLLGVGRRYGVVDSTVLKNVSVARVYNTREQFGILKYAAALMAESRYGLLIVDCVTELYRSEFTDRAELSHLQTPLNVYLRKLRCLADEFGCAVVITNQVVADVDGTYGIELKKPVGGHVLAHFSTTRLSLRTGHNSKRICKVYKSMHLPECEAYFAIKDEGIVDLED